MSRPKGSKNKPKGKKITSEWMKEDHERMKAKYSPDNPIWATDLLASPNQFEWIGQIQAFCEKKGFPPSELIEKFEGLELENLGHKAFRAGLGSRWVTSLESQDKIEELLSEKYNTSQNKPLPAPQIEKQPHPSEKEDKAIEGAENELGRGKSTLPQPFLKEIPTSKPQEFSNFMKARQNAKNGMK